MTALAIKDVKEVRSGVAKTVEYVFLKTWKILENMLSHMVRRKQTRKSCELGFVN